MFDELVKRLRNCVELHGECALCLYQGNGCDAMPETPLIQAADAIEELSKQFDNMNEANIALYGALPRWIPVTERLPEKAGHYIVFVELKRDGQKISAWTQVTLFLGEFILECPENEERFVATVTHWMRPPGPPKEE